MSACNHSEGSLHARLGRRLVLPHHNEDGSAENGQQSAQHHRPRSFKLTIFLWPFAFWSSIVSTQYSTETLISPDFYSIHHISIENLPQSPSVWSERYQTHNEDPLLPSLHPTKMASSTDSYQPLCHWTTHHRRRLGLVWDRLSRPVSHATMARRIRSRLE